MTDVKQLIAQLDDTREVMIDEGMPVYDVDPTYGVPAVDAQNALARMMPAIVPAILEALPTASTEQTKRLIDILRVPGVEAYVAMPDAVHAAVVDAARRAYPDGLVRAEWDRDFARRARAGDFATPEALWRARLRHAYWPETSAAIFALAKLVTDKAAFVRELAPFLRTKNRSSVVMVLRDLPPALPVEFVRELAAELRACDADADLVQELSRYGEPASALVPIAVALLSFHEEDDSRNTREVRWRRAAKALANLAPVIDRDAIEPHLQTLEAGTPVERYCAKDIRDALARVKPTP